MTTATVTQRLTDMYELIPGITKAFQYIPRTLQPAYLPAVVIYPGEAAYDWESVGDGMVRTTEVYRATLYYDQAAFGTETQSETGLLPLIDSIKDYFFQRPGLQLDALADPQADVVFNARLVRSGGYQLATYATGKDTQSDFAAVTFTHEVTEYARVTEQY